MTLVSGIRSGLRSGIRSGINPSAAAVTWDVDATSGWAFPSSSTQWTDFLAANASLSAWSVPDSLHLFQEASGSIADAIGSFPWAPEGTRQDYQQTDAALTRKAARSRGDGWLSTSVSLPDASSSSYLMLAVAKFETAAISTKTTLGTANTTSVQTLGDGVLRLTAGGGAVDGATSQVNAWLPLITQVNRSSGNSFAATIDTDLTVAHGAISGKQELVSGGLVGSGSTLYTYAAVWRGAKAERTAAQIKALQTAMGFSPTWTP